MKIRLPICYTAIILIITGCTIKPPEVIITSEKTTLENQLLGSNETMAEDPLSVAAVWSRDFVPGMIIDTSGAALKGADQISTRKLILSQIRRQTMQDHIEQLKRNGILGEKANGFITAMSDTIRAYAEVQRIVAAENSDRATIWQYYAENAGTEADKALESIRKDFADLMSKTSPTGTWIEDDLGNWSKK